MIQPMHMLALSTPAFVDGQLRHIIEGAGPVCERCAAMTSGTEAVDAVWRRWRERRG